MSKISDLPFAIPMTGDELIPLVQGRVTRRMTMHDFGAFIRPQLQDWYKGDTGDTGPSNNTRLSYAQMREAAISDATSLFDQSLWSWVPGDMSAKVTADTWGGVYVAPIAAPTGKTGAWVRSFKGPASPEWFGAKGNAAWDAATRAWTGDDDTAAIQRALNVCGSIRLGDKAYLVSAVEGLKLGDRMRMIGAGRWTSFLVAKAGGGTIAQLEALTRGSVVKRAGFNRAAATFGDNAYVTGAYLADFGVILTHPEDAITITAIQIGVDLRHCRDWVVERVYVGNYVPPRAVISRPDPANPAYAVQGYGFAVGTLSADDPAYSGGEANTLRTCFAWNLYKGVTIDDVDLSPTSAAYNTTVDNCDIQGAHILLAQYGQYGALSHWLGNRLQNVIKQAGNTAPSAVYWIEGYSNAVATGEYIEAGTGADFLLYLGPSSRRNEVRMRGYTAKRGGVIGDQGEWNDIHCYVNTGYYPGGNDSLGAPMRILNRIADPGPQRPLNVAQGQQIATNATVAIVNGNGAVRTNISLEPGRYLGQRLLILGLSWGVRFSEDTAIWGSDGAPEVGGGDQQCASVQLVWTESGWTQVTRTYRNSTRVPVRANGREVAYWSEQGLNLSAGMSIFADGKKVLGAPQPEIADSGTTDAKVGAILVALRNAGIIAA